MLFCTFDHFSYENIINVDQWDWEKVITVNDRIVEYLKDTVKNIYKAVYETHQILCSKYNIKPILPNDIHFATTNDMIIQYPTLTPKERENLLCQEYGAVF